MGRRPLCIVWKLDYTASLCILLIERQSVFLGSNVPSSDVSMYVCVIPRAFITRWAACGREERRKEGDGRTSRMLVI